MSVVRIAVGRPEMSSMPVTAPTTVWPEETVVRTTGHCVKVSHISWLFHTLVLMQVWANCGPWTRYGLLWASPVRQTPVQILNLWTLSQNVCPTLLLYFGPISCCCFASLNIRVFFVFFVQETLHGFRMSVRRSKPLNVQQGMLELILL